MKKRILAGLLVPSLLVAMFTGCASSGVKNPSGIGVTEMRADEKGFVAGTGVESQDLVAVTDKMARSILDTPQVRNAHSPPVVLLDPVMNETRFPINKDMFLTRIQVLLNSKCEKKMHFLARDRMPALESERDRQRAGHGTSGGDPSELEFKAADSLHT